MDKWGITSWDFWERETRKWKSARSTKGRNHWKETEERQKKPQYKRSVITIVKA